MMGGNPERILVLAKGPTTSGKTTFAEVVRAALGDYAAPYNLSLLKEKQEEGGRADVIAVLPRRLIVASEASHEWVLHADRIKLITGGEQISARRLNSNIYISRVPDFTPWITTNSWPSIPGADRALWMRLKAAPFLVPLDPDAVDVTLRERLIREHLPAVLAWCLRGWEAYCATGLREAPAAAVRMGLDARDEMNELGLFIRDCCEEGSPGEYRVTSQALFSAYEAWVDQNGDPRRAYSKIGFGRALSARGYEPTRWYPDGEEKQVRGWAGIQLNAAWRRVS